MGKPIPERIRKQAGKGYEHQQNLGGACGLIVFLFIAWVARAGARAIVDRRVARRLRVFSVPDAVVAFRFELFAFPVR